jgi:hypothetical protein
MDPHNGLVFKVECNFVERQTPFEARQEALYLAQHQSGQYGAAGTDVNRDDPCFHQALSLYAHDVELA